MKSRLVTLVTVFLVLLSMTLGLAYAQGPNPQAAVGTAFGYQGRLNAGGSPADGAYDFEFGLYNALSGGAQVGGTVSRPGVAVSRGLFAVELDFGNVFGGTALWLEVRVKGPGETSFTTLSPRQALLPTPYALYAAAAPWTGLVGIPAGFADGVDNDTAYTAGVGLTLTANQFRVNFAGTGSATTAARSDHTHPAGAFWSLAGNAGTNPTSNFLGTTDAVSLTLAVSGTAALRLEPTSGTPNLTGGNPENRASGEGVTIGGGGTALRVVMGARDSYWRYEPNEALSDFSTVSGGLSNKTLGYAATVGGGEGNVAAGNYSTVGGGGGTLNNLYDNWGNIAGGAGSTVAGGVGNSAGGAYSAIGGGLGNETSADHATIGGGGEPTPFSPPLPPEDWRPRWGNRVTDDYGTIAGGGKNVAGDNDADAKSAARATVGGGWDNSASGESSTVGGGEGNTASGKWASVPGGISNSAEGNYSFAAGRNAKALYDGAFVWADSADGNIASSRVDQFLVRATGGVVFTSTIGSMLRMESVGQGPGAEYSANIVGGYSGNVASGIGVTIAGGGGRSHQWAPGLATAYPNRAVGNFSTVGGGLDNEASGTTDPELAAAATVAGGYGNRATADSAAIGGGSANRASDYGATVAGGFGNEARAMGSTVGGGASNVAGGDFFTGWYATVPGGSMNTAAGDYSFAAGRRASANNQGCFVWGDSTDAPVTCTTNNRWVARASGGVYFYTNPTLTSGVRVLSGAGSWSSVSDRNLKENFSGVDGEDVLKRLSAIPITTWNYKTQNASIRHIGPVAQDFYAAFGVGEDETLISTIDADGVALAAIKGLHKRTETLRAENTALRQQVSDLESRVAALESIVSALAQNGAGGRR